MCLSILYLKKLLLPKSDNLCDCWGPDGQLETIIDQMDLCHISMSFVIIWHFMSYDKYNIWLILVSKRPSGPQQLHLFNLFWQNNSLKIKNWKLCRKFCPYINFENPLYYRQNLKSNFTYQNDLSQKSCFAKCL